MKMLTLTGAAALLAAAAFVQPASSQTVQIGPGGVQVAPYGQTAPGPCVGLEREARQTRERMGATLNPLERQRLEARLSQIREQQARCGR